MKQKPKFFLSHSIKLGLLLFVLLVLLSSTLLAKSAHLSPLINSQVLANNINQVKVIDIRGFKDSDNFKFVKDSLSAPYPLWRSKQANNPGAVPELDDLESTVTKLGLKIDDFVVIVFAGKNATDFGAAARVYWTLKYLGFKDLAILNGGLKAFEAQFPNLLVDQPATPKSTTPFKAEINDQWLVTTDKVSAQAENASDKITLLDARNDDQYQGNAKHPKAVRFGAIKNSTQLWQEKWFLSGSAELLPNSRLTQIAKEAGISKDQEIYSYCNTGHWAATNWFVLNELIGYQVKLYPDSFVHYSQSAEELLNEPSRTQLLIKEVKSWF